MVQIAVNPWVLNNVTLTIGTDTYEKHVDSVTFTPSSQTQSWTGLALNTYTSTSTATWVCTLNYVQDWDTASSLASYLHANEGTSVLIAFTDATHGTFTSTVTIAPGAIGGGVNQYATSSVTLGCTKPVIS